MYHTPRVGVIGNCKPPDMGVKNQTGVRGPVGEHHMFLTTGSSLQLLKPNFKDNNGSGTPL